MRTPLFVVVGLTLLATVGEAADQPSRPATGEKAAAARAYRASLEAAFPATPADPRLVGRFTLFNGTPQMTRNIMLLDTVTGDTWLLCGDDGSDYGMSGWCKMDRAPLTTAETRALKQLRDKAELPPLR